MGAVIHRGADSIRDTPTSMYIPDVFWHQSGRMRRTRNDRSWDAYAREFGVNLSRARLGSGLSQERVAANAGISKNAYRQYEKGESRPGTPMNIGLKNALALSQALGVSLADLLPDWEPDVTAGA